MMKDKKIEKLINAEKKRQKETIDLIASENFVSNDILGALGSELTNKYSEGYSGRRYYPGNKYYDEIEEIAKGRALKVFGLNPDDWAVNVQPYSGSPANFEIYCALMEPGEKLMGMALPSGGHLTHGHRASLTGKFWTSVQYTTEADGLLNYDEVLKLAKKEKPKVMVSGFTAYPRQVNFEKFGKIANEVGAYFVADISHTAGLIVAGLHPSPFLCADVVMTTTHKTLRGPRGAIIFSNRKSKIAKKYEVNLDDSINKSVFPGLQGGPHNNVTAAMAVAFFEALKPSFKKYQKQVIKNAGCLAAELKKIGFNLVSGGTDTHLILIDLSKSKLITSNGTAVVLSGLGAEKKLETVGIIANRNTVPGDKTPFNPSGLRIGTPAITTYGMKEKEMKIIAHLILNCLITDDISIMKKEVLALLRKFS